ncbi:hypothetical protein O6H91_07G086800 [Diphasiastrum complanatum]|uniref:Uncharacterized protein n=1 Tax=Diphasiastrum complanatum TaxID=34168 RepID=A0ACC2D7N7_DIPCM|nr:hypothetical protein O6H91_07G086800 [Diphasiastrum complanatum]
MVETLRAALRLLPTVKPVQPSCSRASLVRRPATGDHYSSVSGLGFQQQVCNSEQRQQGVAASGLSRFARALLAYVGAGLSTIAANQLSGPSTVQAKEIQSTGNHFMAGAEAPVFWACRTTKRCLLHENAKPSQKLSHSSCDFSHCQSDITYHGCPKTKEEKDLLASIDNWSLLSSQCSPGKQSTMYSELNSDFQKDYQSALDESFMVRFSKSAEFDSLKAEDVSLGSFAYLKTLTSGEVDSPELGYEHRVMPDQLVETDNSISLSLESKDDVGKYEESNQTSKNNVKHEIEAVDKSESRGIVQQSSFLNGEGRPLSTATATSFEQSEHKHMQKMEPLPKLQSKGKLSWRTADTDELAALVARKSLEHMENCDLPPSQSPVAQRRVLENCDLGPSKRHRWDISRSMDRDFLISLLRGHEPVRLETQKLSSHFLDRSDPLLLPHHVPQSPRSLPVVQEHYTPFINRDQSVLSSDGRTSSWSAGGGAAQEGDRGPQLLGEALCRSQTRAREAEKAAAQASLEKERLTQLFFREASLSFTYRQWANSLQAENMCLRLRAVDRSSTWLKQSFMNSYATFDLLSNAGWRHSRKDSMGKEMQQCSDGIKGCTDLKHRWTSPRSDVIGGYSLGVAFAFGLSLAGAGLVLGWSMGWILFAPLVN